MPGLLCNRFNTHIVMKKAKIKIQCFSETTKTIGTFLVDMEGEQLTPTYGSYLELEDGVKDIYPGFRTTDTFRRDIDVEPLIPLDPYGCLIDDQPLIPLREINQKFIHLKMNL